MRSVRNRTLSYLLLDAGSFFLELCYALKFTVGIPVDLVGCFVGRLQAASDEAALREDLLRQLARKEVALGAGAGRFEGSFLFFCVDVLTHRIVVLVVFGLSLDVETFLAERSGRRFQRPLPLPFLAA